MADPQPDPSPADVRAVAPEPEPAPGDPGSPGRGWRVNGLVVLAALVGLGMGATSVFFRWKAPEVAAQVDELRRGVVDDPEGSLEQWLRYGAAQMHQRLAFRALSTRQPWLVACRVETGDPRGPEIWGLDLRELPRDRVTRDGLAVTFWLPEPERLGWGALDGDNAARIPTFEGGDAATLARRRLIEVATWALSDQNDMFAGLAADIPGATLHVRVGDGPG